MKKLFSILLSVLMLTSITAGLDLTAYADATEKFPTSGSCGTNATYVFDEENNTLTISGTGAISGGAFKNMNSNKYSDVSGHKVIINEGITSIEAQQFCGSSAWCIIVSSTVEEIDSDAFGYNNTLSAVVIKNKNCSIESDFLKDSGNRYARNTVFGYSNSTAQTAAENAGWNFTAIDDVDCSAGKHAAVYYPANPVFAEKCTEYTYIEGVCVFCGELVKEYTDEVGNHSYSEAITQEATCTTDGVKTYTCEYCGDTYTETISATGHNFTSSSATCLNCSEPNPNYSTSDNSGYYTYRIVYSSLGDDDDDYESTSKTYSINSTKISKLKKGKKKITAQWKKVKGVKGYQVQVATDKKFKKNKKSVTVNKQKTTKTTIKKLKSNKKYYVRIRTYKVIDGKKVYSKWSKVKTVKTK